MTLKRAMSKDFFSFSMSFILMQAINILIAFFIRRVLGPTQMGTWVVLQIILGYSKFSSFGIGRVVTRDIPVSKGKGDFAYAAKLRNVSFTFVLLTSSILAAVILVTAFILKSRVSEIVFYSSLTLAILSVLQRVINFSTGVLRAERQFEFAAKYNLVSAVVSAVLTVILVWYFRLVGYYFALVLSFVVNACYIFMKSTIPFRLEWDNSEVKRVLKDGIIFVLINFLSSNLLEIDRISVSLFLGVTQVGIYSIVNMVNNVIYALPSIFNFIVWPYLNEAFGANNRPENMKKFVTMPPMVLAVYVPIMIGFLWMVAPYFIEWLLPKYTAGIFPMKIGMFTILFELLLGLAGQTIITYHKHWFMIPILIGVQLVIFGLNFLAAKTGGGIVMIGIITLAGTFVAYLLYYVLCLRRIIPTQDERRRELVKIPTVVGYYLASMLLIDRVHIGPDPVLNIAAHLVIFSALALPVFLYGEKRFGLIKLARNHFSKKGGALEN